MQTNQKGPWPKAAFFKRPLSPPPLRSSGLIRVGGPKDDQSQASSSSKRQRQSLADPARRAVQSQDEQTLDAEFRAEFNVLFAAAVAKAAAETAPAKVRASSLSLIHI